MAARMTTKELAGTTSDALASQIQEYFGTPKQNEAGNSRFLLLFGPPSAQETPTVRALQRIPKSLPFMAVSAREGFSEDAFYQDDGREEDRPWRAACFESPYFSTHGAFVALPPDFTTIDDVEKTVTNLLKSFPEDVQRRYFSGRSPSSLLGKGARNVVYRRPAILLLILPGMAGRSKNGAVSGWPVANMDYEIVEELGTRVALNVGVFGGSAAGNWPSENPTGSWIGGRTSGDSNVGFGRGIAALLIETDLRFGVWCSHGFGSVEGDPVSIKTAPKRVHETFMAPRVASDFPDCFHVVSLPNLLKDTIVLDDPLARQADMAPVLSEHSSEPQKFLVHYESGKILPNPPYRHQEGGTVHQFLRAVPVGGHMRVAATTWKATAEAGRTALKEACNLGRVQDIAAAIVVNCRGRLRLLSTSHQDGHVDEKGPNEELKSMRQHSGRKFPLVGFYGDGETCSTSARIPLHRNWTVATLVFGAELNPRYVSAATRKTISQLEEDIAEGITLDKLAEKIVHGTADLLEVEDCHVRILDPVTMQLPRKANTGEWSAAVAEDIDVSPGSQPTGITSYRAFKCRKEPVVCTRNEAQDRISRTSMKWCVSWEDVQSLVQQRNWFVSIPIYDRAECLGIISFASGDPDYFESDDLEPALEALRNRGSAELGADLGDESLSPTGIRLLAATQVANAMAIHIRNGLMRRAEAEILARAIEAREMDGVAKALTDQAGALLGQGTYLTLMMPNDDGTRLQAVTSKERNGRVLGPKNVFADLTAKDGSEQLGITGYAYRHSAPFFVDDVSTARGEEGPCYKKCIGADICSNYVAPIVDDSGRAIAVLNAEAPAGVLKRSRHLSVMGQLAGHCRIALLRVRRDAEQSRQFQKNEKRLADLEERDRERVGRSLAKRVWLVFYPNDLTVRFLTVIVLLGVLLLIGLLGVDEIVSRQRRLMMISEQINELGSEMVTAGNGVMDSVDKRDNGMRLQERLLELEYERESLLLRINGAQGMKDHAKKSAMPEENDAPHPDSSASREPSQTTAVGRGGIQMNQWVFGKMSSDFILAISMLSWSVIGALTWAVSRQVDERARISVLVIAGMFGGVASLLVVHGGKHIFLAVGDVGQVAFNPWTSAILAFVGGIAAYRTNLLTSFIDHLIEAWGNVVGRAHN